MNNVGIIISDISLSAGTERAVTNLSNSLAKQEGYQVFIISVYSDETKKPYYPLSEKVKVLFLGLKQNENRWGRLSLYKELYTRLSSIIDQYHFTYLLGTTHAYNCLITALRKKVNVIGCEHLNYASCPRDMRIMRRILYPKLDAVVLLTYADKKHYSFVNDKRVFVIPNARSFETTQKADVLDSRRIISVGRLTYQKGYDIMLSMLSTMKNELAGWKVTVYGDGELRTELEEKVRENHLDGIVEFHEPVSNIQEKMLSAAFYLMTSRFEGLPMVLIEAQTCGLPIIAFDCPEGPRDVINDGKNGFLIPFMDEEEYKKRLKDLVSIPELREFMATNAYKDASRFDPDTIAKQWTSLFTRCRRK